jgi:Tol biopolymer transport system component
MPNATNAIHLVNRRGENGWDFAEAGADNGDSDSGLIVYAPAWSPDSAQLAYQRFIGYHALVDINLTEMGNSYVGDGQLLGTGAGWLRPPIFSPDGERMALVENNFSDARGFGGYEMWQAQVLRLDKTGEVFLPEGTRPTSATQADRLFRVTAAAWSPNSDTLAVVLPSGWGADAPTTEPIYTSAGPGEIWRWTPGQAPSELLVEGVDFASPLAWLPPLARSEMHDGGL